MQGGTCWGGWLGVQPTCCPFFTAAPGPGPGLGAQKFSLGPVGLLEAGLPTLHPFLNGDQPRW